MTEIAKRKLSDGDHGTNAVPEAGAPIDCGMVSRTNAVPEAGAPIRAFDVR